MKLLALAALVLAPGLGTAAPPPGSPPGTVIDASADPDHRFVGSPSIVILPDGRYVASHDWFTFGGIGDRTVVLGSLDRGRTWTPSAEVRGQYWSTLFTHDGALYLLGTTSKLGDIVIRRSADDGRTWTDPGEARRGLLVAGRFHCGPTPVVEHAGRLWRAFEQWGPPGPRQRQFGAFVLSAPVGADLLDAANWTRSNGVVLEPKWLQVKGQSWQEGNAVVTPGGEVVDFLRVDTQTLGFDDPFELAQGGTGIPRYELSALVTISGDGRKAAFDPAHGFVHFVGSESMFTIRFDPRTRRYWSIVSKITNPYTGYDPKWNPADQRNVLALVSSADLRAWREETILLRYREGLPMAADARVGFQYVAWQFDGDDLVAASRTAWGGNTFHNANYLTFHRVRNFRRLTPADSPPDLAPAATTP